MTTSFGAKTSLERTSLSISSETSHNRAFCFALSLFLSLSFFLLFPLSFFSLSFLLSAVRSCDVGVFSALFVLSPCLPRILIASRVLFSFYHYWLSSQRFRRILNVNFRSLSGREMRPAEARDRMNEAVIARMLRAPAEFERSGASPTWRARAQPTRSLPWRCSLDFVSKDLVEVAIAVAVAFSRCSEIYSRGNSSASNNRNCC